MKERHKSIPAVYLLLKRGDEYFLASRCNSGYYDGYYSIPAGHMEPEETLMEGLQRETIEEIGITFDPANAKLVHVMSRRKSEGNDGDRIDFFFEVEEWNGEPRICEPDKCDDVKWVHIDAIKEYKVIPYIQDMFHALNQGNVYSDGIWTDQ